VIVLAVVQGRDHTLQGVLYLDMFSCLLRVVVRACGPFRWIGVLVRRSAIPGTLDAVHGLLRLTVLSFAFNNIGGTSLTLALGLCWLGVWEGVCRGITGKTVHLFLI
jgi:hypothetical protein